MVEDDKYIEMIYEKIVRLFSSKGKIITFGETDLN